MNRSGWRSHLTALLTALIAGVSLLGLSSLPAWATAGTIKEFPIPTKSTPIGITAWHRRPKKRVILSIRLPQAGIP